MLYFALLVLFLALVIGPLVAGPKVNFKIPNNELLQSLMQPTGFNHNDTVSSETGTHVQGGGSPATTDNSGGSPTTDTSAQTTAPSKFRVRRH